MSKNDSILPAMLEGGELREKQKECWSELARIVNGVALGDRIGVSVLGEGGLLWAMFADWIKVAKGKECRQKQKEVRKVNLKDLFVPFVSLFATKV